MCGRYANFLTEQELVDSFAIATLADDVRLLPPSWNVAPTQDVVTVMAKEGDPAARSAELARWGLVPSWAKDPGIGSRMINARVETIAEKPSFRSSFAKRRCLVPANGYYEWRVDSGVKTPHFIHNADGTPLAFAGLYEWWREKQSGPEAPWLLTCTIVTTNARDRMRELHDRQPVMLEREHWDTWLAAHSTADDLFAAVDAPTPDLTWHPVAKAVGNVRNNEPSLIAPVQ
jgi:putative SOS response-associated peptidase YedK